MRCALIVMIALLGACEPEVRDGQFHCDPMWADSCPPGLVCLALGVEHRCYSSFENQCGNGQIDPGEQCDVNNIPQAACSSLGIEGGTAHCIMPLCQIYCSVCGNNTLDFGEVCDDSNTTGGDGCSADCRCLVDADGDGYGENCVSGGADACDDDPDNWTANGCANCTDADGDGERGTGCDQVEDCYDQDPMFTGQCGDMTVVLPWRQIPGGSFSMGSDTGEADEQPVHTVVVPTFEMTMTEVTVQQYGACVTSGPCTAPETFYQECNWNDPGYEDHPVNCVYWQQAVDFCTWAGGRLPSEAEWEYAARSAGQDITYPWGNDTATCSYVVMNGLGDWGCGTGRTVAPCSIPAGNTSQGLCDMSGNVWEFVQDWTHSDYTGAPTDGSAWESPAGSLRVVRGGSFYDGANALRAASRDVASQPGWFAHLGFRCAR